MARPLRIEFDGAFYHVTSRGNARQDIYLEPQDYLLFLDTLGDVCKRYNWRIHAYCLMTNHYHLVVETPEGNLSLGMRQLNGVYSQAFNNRHKRVGHVFQGRYKSILVDKDSYLKELSRYVILNPVRAKMVELPEGWRWSSYLAMIGKTERLDWLEYDWLLSQFSSVENEAVSQFERFVLDGLTANSPWLSLRNQIYLGDENFVERCLNQNSKTISREIPLLQRRKVKPLCHHEKSTESRDQAIKSAYLSGGYSQKEIGEYFGLHYSRVSRIIAKGKT